MLEYLSYGVIVSCAAALVSLTFLVFKTFTFGRKKLFAEARGNRRRGISYAFIKGMLPWEKESARDHLPSYVGGILYHCGIFATLLYLAFVVFAVVLPHSLLVFFRVMSLAGLFAGIALLVKRIVLPYMRRLSCPDDLAANIIVDVFLGFGLLHTFNPGLTPYFFLVAIIMFLYMPFGKIRHCFFFFYTRILFGSFYGRRGVFPKEKQLV